jgi:WD40 repeat protein
MEGHPDSVESLAFSQEGNLLVSGGESGTVWLWNVRTGRELWHRREHTDSVRSVAFTRDGRLLASGAKNGRVLLWKTETGTLWKTEANATEGSLEAHASPWLAFSLDGRLLAAGGSSTPVKVWRVAPQREPQPAPALESFAAEPGTLASLRNNLSQEEAGYFEASLAQGVEKLEPVLGFSPDGRVMATRGRDGALYLKAASTGAVLRRLAGDARTTQSVAFSPDGRIVALGESTGGIMLWELASGNLLHRLEGNSSSVLSLVFSPNGSRLASGGTSTRVHLWDTTTGHELRALANPLGTVLSQAFTDEASLVIASASGWRRSNVDSGAELVTAPFKAPFISAAISPDGEHSAFGKENGKIALGKQADVDANFIDAHAGPVLSMAISADGETLASGGADGRVRLWKRSTGSPLPSPKGSSRPIRAVAFSPDGRILAFGGDDRTVQLWDVRSGSLLPTLLKGHTDSVWALAFHPDGQMLASGGNDKKIRLWNVNTGRLVRPPLQEHGRRVMSLAFSPDGRSLASGDQRGAVRLWSLQEDKPLRAILHGARQGWLSHMLGHPFYRADDGRFLMRLREDGAFEPVLPSRRDVPPRLSANVVLQAAPGDFGDDGELVVSLSNTSEQGHAYWVRVEPVELPSGLLLLPPDPITRLNPGSSTEIRIKLSYVRPEGTAPLKDPRVRIKIVHATGEEPAITVPIQLLTPELVMEKVPQVKDKTLTFTLKNKGTYATGALSLVGEFQGHGKQHSGARHELDTLDPNDEAPIAIPLSPEVLEAGKFNFKLVANYAEWPRTWTFVAPEVRVPIPYPLYIALGLGAVLLFGFVYYARVYRNPMVVHASRAPATLKSYPLAQMVVADHALRRARRLDSTITAAGIPATRWQRALCGARSPQDAATAFAEVVGGKLGASLGSNSWALSLPPLRLRFSRDTAVVVIDGTRLESGDAERRMADIFQDGRGPSQVLVLDRTHSQNARQVLEGVPRVRCVVLSDNRLRDLLLADEPVRLLETTISEQVAVSELSPYQVAGGVKIENLFFGREREVRAMADRSMRNFLVVGQRQMGKSSLLLAVLRRLQSRSDLDASYVELADADLHRRLARERDRVPADGAPLPPLVEVAAGTPSRPRVWLIDEADDFISADAKAGYPVLQAMRALAEEGRAYFILAGFWDLYRAVVLDEKQPLRNFGEHLRLEPLDPRAALALVTEPMTALGLQWDAPSTPEFLVEQAGRRANLLVLACKALVESLPPDTHVLTREHLERVLREDKDLRDQGRRWRGDHPLHRAVVRQALLLGRPTREEVRQALASRGADIRSVDFDEAMDHRELSYVLVPDGEGRLHCPVPLMQRYIESERGLEAGLTEDLADLRRRGLAEVPKPA